MSEELACQPLPIREELFNPGCVLPYGLTVEHVQKAMNDFIDFLGFINQQLYTKQIPRLESFLMPANFSSIVGEFTTVAIPKYCPGLVKTNTTTAILTYSRSVFFLAMPSSML
jgi:hypothetical protein